MKFVSIIFIIIFSSLAYGNPAPIQLHCTIQGFRLHHNATIPVLDALITINQSSAIIQIKSQQDDAYDKPLIYSADDTGDFFMLLDETKFGFVIEKHTARIMMVKFVGDKRINASYGSCTNLMI